MHSSVHVSKLLSRFPIISEQIHAKELAVLLNQLERVMSQGISGDVVEFGCYKGTSALFLQRLLIGSDRLLYLYDSFQGLPAKTRHDTSPVGEQFIAGELYANKTQLINNFKHAGLPLPRIVKGWFSDVKPHQLPNEIAFAFLDGDFYESIIDSLRLVWPRLSKGAVVVVDDYQTEALPGVRRALEDWRRDHAYKLTTEASLAIIEAI